MRLLTWNIQWGRGLPGYEAIHAAASRCLG